MKDKEYTVISSNNRVLRMLGSSRVECSIQDLENELASMRAKERRSAEVSDRIAQVNQQLAEYRGICELLRKLEARQRTERKEAFEWR
ncbi:MAG TPA: hypothetical protein VGG64_04855 [Pirellulales bacterium]